MAEQKKKPDSTAKKVAKGAGLAIGTAAAAGGLVKFVEALYGGPDIPGARPSKYPGGGLYGLAGSVARNVQERDRLHAQRSKSPVKRPNTRT